MALWERRLPAIILGKLVEWADEVVVQLSADLRSFADPYAASVEPPSQPVKEDPAIKTAITKTGTKRLARMLALPSLLIPPPFFGSKPRL